MDLLFHLYVLMFPIALVIAIGYVGEYLIKRLKGGK